MSQTLTSQVSVRSLNFCRLRINHIVQTRSLQTKLFIPKYKKILYF